MDEPLTFFERESRIELYDFNLETVIRCAHFKLENSSYLAKLDPDDPYDILEFLDDTLMREGESFKHYRRRKSFTPTHVDHTGDGPLVRGIGFDPTYPGRMGHHTASFHLPPQAMVRQLKQMKQQSE
jgi:hypothetical protein